MRGVRVNRQGAVSHSPVPTRIGGSLSPRPDEGCVIIAQIMAGRASHERKCTCPILRKVALKVLKPELAAVVGGDRFLAEIKTTANVRHPHILALHDSGEADSFLSYVMPFVEGESLQERLEREKQLPVDEALSIGNRRRRGP